MRSSIKFAPILFSLLSSNQLVTAQDSSTICSCSPQTYSFTLDFSQTCNDDTLANSSGIWTTVCSTDSNFAAETDCTEMIPDVGESLVRRFLGQQVLDGKKDAFTMATDDMVPVKITCIVFAEVHSDGSLVIMNKDESLVDVNLEDGAVVEFESISKTLDPGADVEDLISRVPGGVLVLLVGENTSGELVRTRMLWMYENDCNAVPLTEIGVLGWIRVGAHELASDNFCPLQSTIPSDDAFIAELEDISEAAKAEAAPHSNDADTKAGKVGKATTVEMDNSQGDALFTKTGKIGKSTTDTLFAKTGKRSGKAEYFVAEEETTQTTHSMSLDLQGNEDMTILRKGKTGKAKGDTNSSSKSQKQK